MKPLQAMPTGGQSQSTNPFHLIANGLTPWLRRLIRLMAIGAYMILSCQDTSAQTSSILKLKVAYLYNFTRYVDWPEQAFKNESDAFVIGVLDGDPHAHLLVQVAKRKTAKSRPMAIRSCKSIDDFAGCHLVFLSNSVDESFIQQTITRTVTTKTLLILDSGISKKPNVPIHFFDDSDGTIGLRISIDAMQRRELRADAKLLNIATVVRN